MPVRAAACLVREENRAPKRASGGIFLTLLAAAATAAACSSQPGDPDPGAVPIVGKYVTLYHQPNTPICAGTVPHLDASAKAIADYLGLGIKAPISYYYMPQIQAQCVIEKAIGCAIYDSDSHQTTVFSESPALIHELVHAIQMDHAGYAPSFLLEGQAVALSDPMFGDPALNVPDSELLQVRPLPSNYYSVAGDFVSYLVVRFGVASYEHVLALLDYDSTPDAIESAFTKVYGESLTMLRSDRAASSQHFTYDRLGLPECTFSPDPQISSGQEAVESVDCATNAIGNQGAWMLRYVSFTVPADGFYSIELKTQSANDLVFLNVCGGGPSFSYGPAEDLEPDSAIVGYMPKGSYVFQLETQSSTGAVNFSLGVHPITPADASSCGSTIPADITATTKHLFFFSADRSTDTQALALPFRVDAPVHAYGESLDNLSTAQLCSDPCTASQCYSSLAIPVPTLDPGTTYSLMATFSGDKKIVAIDFY